MSRVRDGHDPRWLRSSIAKDLKDRKLYTVEKPGTWPRPAPLIGDTVETAASLGQWTELMRLKASIETGAVVPSVILPRVARAHHAGARARGSVAGGPGRALANRQADPICEKFL